MAPFFLWFEEHIFLGIFIYIMLYITFVILVIPGTILTLGGAYTFAAVFGPIKGFFIAYPLVMISASIGAFFAFLIGRFLIRSCIRKYFID
jgi:uncharacterized membrane protein YdjX (TVP38/TMEM64 family)